MAELRFLFELALDLFPWAGLVVLVLGIVSALVCGLLVWQDRWLERRRRRLRPRHIAMLRAMLKSGS